MVHRSKELKRQALLARDGEIDRIAEVYFDDELWTVSYLVVDTGGCLSGYKVLISPASLTAEQGERGVIRADLTRQQVEDSPGVETDQPVSRQYEIAHAVYYGYPTYWAGPDLSAAGAPPMSDALAQVERDAQWARAELNEKQARRSSHLRSCAEVTGYRIEARDGAIGHVEDFLIDARSWQIRQMVVDTRNWLPGRHVMVDPQSIERVDWPGKRVHVGLARGQIRRAPEFQR